MNVIDRRKNVCYVIEVPYVKESRSCDYKYQKFISLHQAHTKHFERFRDKYFKEVLKVSVAQIGEWDKMECTTASQQTISIKEWRDAAIRLEVLKGITDREKCW